MKYFLFSITNTCNKSCSYCITKEWVNNLFYPDKIDEETTFKWFDENTSQGDVVEITGGEPTTVSWLETFVEMLNNKSVNVIIRTNGFKLFQNRYENVIFIVNMHGDTLPEEQLAKLRDTDIIIKPKLVCENDKPKFEPDVISRYLVHEFDDMRFITADGKIRYMSCKEECLGYINKDYSTEPYPQAQTICRHCPFATGAFNLVKHLKWSIKYGSR